MDNKHRRIALAYLPFVQEFSIPPSGISYLAAYLKENNYQVELFDLNLELITYMLKHNNYGLDLSVFNKISGDAGYDLQILNQYYISIERCANKILSVIDQLNNNSSSLHHKPLEFLPDYMKAFLKNRSDLLGKYDVIGFSVIFPTQLCFAIAFSKLIKQNNPNAKIIFGGTAVSKKSLMQYATAIFTGDGEEQLIHFLENYDFNKNDKFTGKVELINKLDYFPAPDFTQLFKKYNYFSPSKLVPLAITRGCYWGKCRFCSYGWVENRACNSTAKYRKSSVRLIVNQIKYLMKTIKVRHFYFSVDVVDPMLLWNLSTCLLDNKIEIFWRTEIRAENKFLEPGFLQHLYKAGCRTISFGLESVEQRVLDVMNKGVNVNNNKNIIDALYNAGIGINTDFFIGFPSETLQEGLSTQQFIFTNSRKIMLHDAGGVFLVFAKSPIAKMGLSGLIKYDVKTNGWIKEGMSFEEQEQLQKMAFVNMLCDSKIIRFPFRNDGAMFFLYCSKYGVRTLCSQIENTFIPEKIYIEIKMLFAFVFHYLSEEQSVVMRDKLIKLIKSEVSSYLESCKSKSDKLHFYKKLVYEASSSVLSICQINNFFNEIIRFNYYYLKVLLVPGDYSNFSRKDCESSEMQFNFMADEGLLCLSPMLSKIYLEEFAVDISLIVNYQKYKSNGLDKTFVIFTRKKVLIRADRLLFEIFEILQKHCENGVLFSRLYEIIGNLYSRQEVEDALQQLIYAEVVTVKNEKVEGKAEKIYDILSKLESQDLTVSEADLAIE